MTQTQYTPGPWEVSFWLSDPEDSESKMRFVYAPSKKPLGSKTHYEIATCCTGDPSDGEEGANARLIAASPDMLDALFKNEQLICAAQEILHDYLLPDSRQNEKKTIDKMLELFDGPFQREVQKKNRETIAKARGQS